MKYVLKGQYGFGFPVITISPKEYLNKGAEVLLKAMEPVGKAVTKVVAALPSSGPTAMPYFPTTVEEVNRERENLKMREKVFEEDIAPALSPSNHVVAWTQGSMNPKVGQHKIAEWGPLALLASLGVDMVGFKYAPKGVKATTRGTKAAVTKAIKNSKAKEVSKTIDKVVDEGFKPRLSSDKNLYRTTTDKEVSALKSGRFRIHPNGGNHGVYGWRKGEPFYQPGSWVESKMVGKRNGLSGVDNPTYLVAPIKEDLQVRIGSGGKYGEPVPATQVESGTYASYHPSGGLAYDNSSVAFLPEDPIPNNIVAWSKRNGQWLFEPIELPKQIFRARVYKGGDITDPHSNFVTTDRRYASLYGPVTSYEFESRYPTFTNEPMMGYRDPVSLDMFVYKNTKSNPNADAIIGHDKVTGEFPYTSLGIEILNLNPKNLTRATKQRRVISERTYPWYRGKQHSVKEVVNPDGTVNPRLAMRILHEVSELFPGSYKMEHRLENKEYHPTDPTTYNHTKNVAQSAWGLDVPYGFTKHDLMVAALGHDLGKVVSGDGHAQIGADLAKQIFPDLTDAQYTAIAEHMGTPETPLGKATKMADMRNGIVVRNINGKTRILLPTHTDVKPREIVLDPQGNNKYYVHMRVWDDVDKHIPGNISNVEKSNLFQTLYETLPDGAEILFPKSGPENYGTRGTVAGLLRLSRDPRFQPGTPGTLYYKGKNNEVQTYQGTSFIKKPLFGFEGYPFEGRISMADIQGFIDNDIIPRLKELGHQIESYTPNIRSADFLNDIFDLKMRGENAGAWFSPATNEVTLRGPLENQDFGLVVHEAGGHGIRYNMQSDYKPVSREIINKYLTNPEDPTVLEPLLNSHFGREVFNNFEVNTLGDAYPEIAGYFENFTNRLSGQKLSPEALAKRILDELGAVNTQFRAKLSENGRLTGKALDKKIQETPEGVILRMEIEQGYTSMGILERISKITGVSMDELNFYNPASLQKLVQRFPELKVMADKVKYAMTHVAVGSGVMYGLNQYGMRNENK